MTAVFGEVWVCGDGLSILLSGFKAESCPGAVSVCRDCLQSPGNKPSPKWLGGASPTPWEKALGWELQEAVKRSQAWNILPWLWCVLCLRKKAKFVCKSKQEGPGSKPEHIKCKILLSVHCKRFRLG